MKTNLTKKGKELLLAAFAGEELHFTKIILGNGISDGGDAVINPLLSVEISNISVSDDYVTITSLFTNSEVDGGFRVTEAGIYALDGEEEALYATVFTDEGSADYIPSKDERLLEFQYDFLVFIGEAQNVSAAINGSIIYVSNADFEKHVNDTENPHKVTKVQVGLGKVPNVATNDQTPTFTESTTLSELKSGEKLSVIFGKLAGAVKFLIAHIANKKNPHGVTASQIGAAPGKHTHSAADFNSGILSPERGGTGVSSIEAFSASISSAAFVTGVIQSEGLGHSSIERNPRIVDLGFHPRAVLLFKRQVGRDGAYAIGGLALRGYPVAHVVSIISAPNLAEWDTKRCMFGIAENGIILGTVDEYPSDTYFYYIAFR